MEATGTRAVLDHAGLRALVGALRERGYTVIGPTVRDQAIVLDEIESVDDLPRGWTDEQEGGSYRLRRRDDGALFGYAVGRPPRLALAVLALLLMLVAAGLLPLHLPGSPWRVQRSWGRLGHVGYSTMFGIALGTGLATALSSPGLYVVMAWGLAAPGWQVLWPVFLAFGLGRAVPTIAIAANAVRRPAGSPKREEQAASAD